MRWGASLGAQLTDLGHDIRLIPPAYVKPLVKRQKSDAVDAEATCEAAQRPGMRFVAIKTEEQQAATNAAAVTDHRQRCCRASGEQARRAGRVVAGADDGKKAAHAGDGSARQQDGTDRLGRADEE